MISRKILNDYGELIFMSCNCGKNKKEFKDLIQKNTVNIPTPSTPSITQPVTPMTRAERIRLRTIRIENRNKRMAARNAAILAAKQAEEARKIEESKRNNAT